LNIKHKLAGLNLNPQLPSNSRILIVDDEISILKHITYILKNENYQIVTASDGKKALEIIAENPNFDLVILDIMMPDISGIEVCKKIRQKYDPFEMPILFCSALSESTDLSRGLSLGANDYIGKPLKKLELLARIINLTSLKHINDLALTNERLATHRAHHDELTGLANRSYMNLILQDIITKSKKNRNLFAVIFIDLKRFLTINSSYGIIAGDIYLKEISKRLKKFISSKDVAIRLHSNTFGVIKTGIKIDGQEKKNVSEFVSELDKMLNKPVFFQQTKVHLTTQIGIALYPNDAESIEKLLHCADSALLQSKSNSKGLPVFYEKNLHTAHSAEVELERKLESAFENEEFILYYQPQINVETQEITGVEALLRWLDPEKGIIPPSKFIPIAEEMGLIVPMSKWVLKKACSQIKEWQDMGYKPIRIGINISPQFVYSPNLVDFIKYTLAEIGMEPSLLELEITESTIMPNDQEGIAILKQLKMLGIGIAIDDFGAGYSSLNYLKELPITTLKIDQSLIVSDLSINTQTGTIVKTIIKLGHSLGLLVIAEGVETEKQLTFLKENFINEIQGFYYSEALSPEKLITKLKLISD